MQEGGWLVTKNMFHVTSSIWVQYSHKGGSFNNIRVDKYFHFQENVIPQVSFSARQVRSGHVNTTKENCQSSDCPPAL